MEFLPPSKMLHASVFLLGKVDEIPAKYAQDLQAMAKWCLAASSVHMDKRERA
jgi:hypothetical protein